MWRHPSTNHNSLCDELWHLLCQNMWHLTHGWSFIFGLPQSPYSCRIDLPDATGDIVGATSMTTSQGLCFLRKGLCLSKTSARQAFQEWTLWAKQNAWEVWRQSANFCTISWLILLGLLHNTLLHWRVRICAFVWN